MEADSPPDPDDLGLVAGMAFKKIRTALMEDIAGEDPEDLRKYILTDYDMVLKETPEEVRKQLSNYGPKFDHLFWQFVRPENIYYWVANPDWVPSEDLKDDLRRCAEILDETPGSAEWLDRQVYTIWALAGLETPDDVDVDVDVVADED